MTGLITLLTDFGWDDPYVAEMKAAILDCGPGKSPDHTWPRLIDLCHTILAGDIAGGSWFLGRIWRRFPPGTVHLAVIDPGVGTVRPRLAIEAAGQGFVGPGNGLFQFLRNEPSLRVVLLEDRSQWPCASLPEPSTTFEGRDIFAPAAALLAAGIAVARLGVPGNGEHLGSAPVTPEGADRQAVGLVVWIDHFGNAITDLARSSALGHELSRGARLWLGTTPVDGPYRTFAEGPADDPFWYWGSGGTLEVALRGASASGRYAWRRGLALRRSAP